MLAHPAHPPPAYGPGLHESRREFVRVGKRSWESVRAHENQWKFRRVGESSWKSARVHVRRWEFLCESARVERVAENSRESARGHENRWEIVHESQREVMKITDSSNSWDRVCESFMNCWSWREYIRVAGESECSRKLSRESLRVYENKLEFIIYSRWKHIFLGEDHIS